MPTKHFSFNGIKWEIACEDSGNLDKLTEDFHCYHINHGQLPHFRIEISTNKNSFKLPAILLSGKSYKFSLGWKKRHFLFDKDLVGIEKINSCRELFISGHNHDRLREVVLSYVLSVLGELNDLKGWHRLHALSFLHNGRAVTVPLNSAGGKSSFTFWLAFNTKHKILSDETVYTDGQQALGFFTRIALRVKPQIAYEIYKRKGSSDKYLIRIPDSQLELKICPLKLWLPSNRWGKVGFLVAFVFGLGNTQMIEFMIRPDNFLDLILIFFKRLRVGIELLRNIEMRSSWSQDETQNFSSI